ncbi:MAG TPA: hypothetical protein VMT17_00830, partial [Anaeromyxobacteraceae bacterium]|nr:hypothetical protein [Anaeromyxobacteraceae bacterium]
MNTSGLGTSGGFAANVAVLVRTGKVVDSEEVYLDVCTDVAVATGPQGKAGEQIHAALDELL